ncbi:DUF1479-domain-containing protein [Aureobasidium pullulans]|nr:DUF1479-domain-containing protein [Aureobasidium pullulans]
MSDMPTMVLFLKSSLPTRKTSHTQQTFDFYISSSPYQLGTDLSMPGAVDNTWSPWPQLTLATAKGVQAGTNEYTEAIYSKYGAEALKSSWVQVCKRLESITENIASQGNSVIPELDLEDFLSTDMETKHKLKDIGCFIVRHVVSEEQATDWYNELKNYVKDNQAQITVFISNLIVSIKGMPADTPFMFDVYHSPVQQAARSHPNSLAVQRAINALWHDKSVNQTTIQEPLSYADGFRIRPENTIFNALPPHIDGGSLSRWADDTYREVYSAIWSGNPDAFDPYDLSIRKDAKPGLFPGTASQVLRAFQGWTALTSAGANEGSLLLYPDVKTAMAYVILRPLFDAPEDQCDIMDATKWTLNAERGWFPGTWRQLPQIVSPASHPHLRLGKCLVNIPTMRPGDTVWWHADMIHGVDVQHTGDHDSAVLYIAAVPTTEANTRYMRQQVVNFKAGVPPEDFARIGTDETIFRGYKGEEGILNGQAGRKAAGLYL